MGGLRHSMPYTFLTYTIAVLAITGTPLTAGFFSKDEILWQAISSPHGSRLLWGLGVATAGLTAFYMFRQFFLVFFGESRVDSQVKAHLHESPKVMTYPLVLLATLLALLSMVACQPTESQKVPRTDTPAANPSQTPKTVPSPTPPATPSPTLPPERMANADVLEVRAVLNASGTWTFHVTQWSTLTPGGKTTPTVGTWSRRMAPC